MKKCSKCEQVKEICEFGVDNTRKNGLKPYCRKCRRDESDKKKDKKRKHLWYQNNRALTIKRSCVRQIEKRVERNIYLSKYYNKKPHIYLWRSLVYRTIKGKIKIGSTFDLLGYSYDELRIHIESLFTDGMNWENYGEWHVDHIKPLSKFKNDEPISVVNALSNLQPLWATTREINGIIYEGNLNKLSDYDEELE